MLGLHYMMPWPNRELESARPFRRSPLYDRLAAKGARVRLEDGLGAAELLRAARGRAHARLFLRPPELVRHASRPSSAPHARGVAVFDLTSFAKLLVQGRDAESVLQRLAANDVAVPVGASVYTGLLNARGTYESDVTVARLAPTGS